MTNTKQLVNIQPNTPKENIVLENLDLKCSPFDRW